MTSRDVLIGGMRDPYNNPGYWQDTFDFAFKTAKDPHYCYSTAAAGRDKNKDLHFRAATVLAAIRFKKTLTAIVNSVRAG